MDPPIEKAMFRVEPDEAGQRLDAFLARRDSSRSRSRYQTLIREAHVTIDGAVAMDPNLRLTRGAAIAVVVTAPMQAAPVPEAMPLSVLYEDADLIVIDKPAGLVVHPGAGHHGGTLVNALLAHCGDTLSGVGGVRRPGIVHRLDKDTSGVLVVAKNDLAHQGLAAQFADHGRAGILRREYDALVWGEINPHVGTVDAALQRDIVDRRKQRVGRAGRNAVTHYESREQYGEASLVSCRLETGRTHQIRVHMASIGHPLVGDLVYGSGFLTKAHRLAGDLGAAVKVFRRQALHARLLAFAHPRTGAILQFETNWPEDMANLVKLFRESAAH
jgi:23S rRNA pseudouridine1911/1915/1917 synthase